MGNIVRSLEWLNALTPPEYWGEEVAPELSELWLCLRAFWLIQRPGVPLAFDLLSQRPYQPTPYVDPLEVSEDEYTLRVKEIVDWVAECAGVIPIPFLCTPAPPVDPEPETPNLLLALLQDILSGGDTTFPWVPEPTPPTPTPPPETPPE